MIEEALLKSDYYEIHQRVLKQRVQDEFRNLLAIDPQDTHTIADRLGMIRGLESSMRILEDDLKVKKNLADQELRKIEGIDQNDEFFTGDEEEVNP